jgi:D-serine deaminase-like pyridoxal phosphate-dependent protein
MSRAINQPKAPAIVIDLPNVDRNVQRMANCGRAHDVGIRPHTKSHQSSSIATLQMQHVAVGLTAPKIGQAEVMAAAEDPLAACATADAHGARRAPALARKRGKKWIGSSTEAVEAA